MLLKPTAALLEHTAEALGWSGTRPDAGDAWKRARVLVLEENCVEEHLEEALSEVKAWKRDSPLFLDEEYVADHLQEAVFAVLTKRRGLLQAQGWTRTAPPSAAAGRWLVLKTGENLMDGAAYFASGGLLGELNFPPCDWWVEYVTEGTTPLLVSWVPGIYGAAIQSGIDVNPEECLGWAELG